MMERKRTMTKKNPKKDKNGHWLVDKKGNKIDRTPPKKGESHERTNAKGYKEFWCGNPKCCRWGSHPTKDHDKWAADSKAYKHDGTATPNATPAVTTNRPAGTVSFLSALTCGTVRPDNKLTDGIEI